MERLNILVVLVTLGVATSWTIACIKEIKEFRNSVPNGKAFVKKFYNKVISINIAQQVLELPNIVSQEMVPEGLEYKTIPKYKSFCIYIEDEAVCRVHILEVNYKNKICFDFSSKRPRCEIIEIIDEAYLIAEKELKEFNKKYYNINKNSFYSDTERND